MFCKLKYFTEYRAEKAAFAMSSTAVGMLAERFCGNFPTLCALVSENSLFMILFAMMTLDMFTGALASRSEGSRITSRRLGEGIKRKLGMLAMVAGATLLGRAFGEFGLDVQEVLYRGVASWFIGVEFLSLYENVDRMQIRLPTALKSVAEKMLQKSNESVEAVVTPEDRKSDV